jgi:hypothetical protein
VDGHHAVQLNRISYGGLATTTDDFDTCAWTTVYSRSFSAPKKGVLALTGTLRAERDFGTAAPSILQMRLTIDGAAVSGPLTTSLGAGDAYAGSIANTGAKVVPAGAHTIGVQAQECSAGVAFLQGRQLTASFSPFGSAGAAPTFRTAARQVR